jgi:hypothetical protein
MSNYIMWPTKSRYLRGTKSPKTAENVPKPARPVLISLSNRNVFKTRIKDEILTE